MNGFNGCPTEEEIKKYSITKFDFSKKSTAQDKRIEAHIFGKFDGEKVNQCQKCYSRYVSLTKSQSLQVKK